MTENSQVSQSAKQGFGALLDDVASKLKKKSAPKESQLSQISYFEVDNKSRQFVRVWAYLVTLQSHELQVKIGSDIYALSSARDLTAPGCLVGNILRFFAYSKDPKHYKQLYALPPSAHILPAEAAVDDFHQLEDKDRENIIEESSSVKAARKENETARNEFVSALKDVQNFVSEQAQLSKNFPNPQGVLDANSVSKIVGCLNEERRAARPSPTRSPVVVPVPSESSPVEEVNPPSKKGNKKGKRKVPKNMQSDHAKNLRRLLSKG